MGLMFTENIGPIFFDCKMTIVAIRTKRIFLMDTLENPRFNIIDMTGVSFYKPRILLLIAGR